MTETQLFEDILLLGTAFWIILCLMIHFLVMRFIVPRYEKETNLGDTIFFTERMPITRYLPAFWSSIGYAAHLLFCLRLWKWRKKFKGSIFLRDLGNAEQVTGHFSKKEIWLVYLDVISLIIGTIHMFFLYLFGLPA